MEALRTICRAEGWRAVHAFGNNPQTQEDSVLLSIAIGLSMAVSPSHGPSRPSLTGSAFPPRVVVTSLAEPSCTVACQEFFDANGFHAGYGCVTGTQGFDCIAIWSQCSLETTGCNQGPGGDNAPFDVAASRVFRTMVDFNGKEFVAQLSCDVNANRVFPASMVAVGVQRPVGAAAVPSGATAGENQ